MQVQAFRALRAAAILIGSLALYVAVGWAMGVESMVRVWSSSTAMPLNTAILFLAGAVCLWPVHDGPSSNYRFWSLGRVASAWLMVGLSGAMLVELGFGVDLGVDWPSLHRQVNDGNPYPGRSAPNSSLGFLLAGASFLALARDQADLTRRRLADVPVFATLLVGVSALLINVLNLEALYTIASYHRMATLSAYGLTLLGLGLWLKLQAQSRSAESKRNPDQRIVRTAVVVLSVVVVSAGLGGFAVLKQGFEDAMSTALLRNTVNSATAFQSIIDQRIVLGRTIAERPGLQKHLARLSIDPQDAQALALAREVAQSFLSSGITGIRMFNAQGDPVLIEGDMLKGAAEMEVPVHGHGQDATMLWKDGFVLRTTNAMQRDGKPVGTVIAEQRLTGMTALLRSADVESASTDILVCGRKADDAVCFPSRFYKANMHIPMYKDGKPYLAISRALLGQKGVIFVKDLRGLTVFAGHAPLGGTGLGMVFKTDSVDLFAPIRHRLNSFVGLLVFLIGAGTWLLRAQIQPLARRLVSAQQRTAAILASSHEAFIEMDRHGVIRDWNREAELTFGWTLAEAVGKDLAEFIIPPDLRDAYRRDIALIEIGQGPVLGQRTELMTMHRNGDSIMVEITISAIKDNDEYRFTAFMHSIDERKQAEADLLAAKQQADSANRAKGQFLANMSHEIRTPMNAVLGMLQLVQKTALDVRQQDYVGKAQSAAKSLLGLLNDILDFSKMDAGKLQLDLHPFDLEGLMRDLAIVLSGAQSDTEVEVIFEIDPALPLVLRGDRLRLQQILINLGSNAVKFTQAGQVVIRLSQTGRTADALTLRVEISDTGIGITPEQLARIFDGFTQAEASTTRRFGGSGLGLVISQRLVGLMGGNLRVQSELGEGSRFWFDITLPVETATQVVVMPASLPHGLRVLVVEDNPLSREILTKTLEGMGWTADSASSGTQGVESVRRAQDQATPYDVVLMDWRMPGMDGLAAAALIRQELPASQAPVIIMVTAFGREVLAEVANRPDAPFVDFLTKPVTPQQLTSAIQKALAGPVAQADFLSGRLVPTLRLKSARLLLVEDNALNRQVATELLRGEGAEVAVAEGGMQGVSMATQQGAAFDVIIMDVQMPDLDGLEATRRIRAHAQGQQTPILAMTANASAADRDDCLAAGMNDHIAKPIDIDELVARLLTLLGGEVKTTPLALSVAKAPEDALVEASDLVLKRFGQKLGVYHMALSGFKAEGARLLAELQKQVASASLTEAGATMHAMKGIAATVGAAALAKVAAGLEHRAKAEPSLAPDELFSTDTLANLTDLVERSDAALAVAVLPDLAANVPSQRTGLVALTSEQKVARLLEIQALLRVGNLRAIDLTQELLALTSGTDKLKVQGLLDITEQLQFSAAEKAVQMLLEGVR